MIWRADASHKLAPLTQISGWNLENFSDKDRKAFLEFTNGEEVILEQGECMFIPMIAWHYVDYLDDSMSISLRFRRPNFMTKLANMLFPDLYYQGIAEKIGNQIDADSRFEGIMEKIENEWNKHSINGVEKTRSIRKLAKDIYFELYPEAPRKSYFLELEEYFPALLPTYLDAYHPQRPIRQ